MEKILKITEYTETDKEGYEVVTDKQTITLCIENDQQCCETWGYFWCNENPQNFVGSELHSVNLTDTELNTKYMRANAFEGNVMFVNLNTSKGTLQFVAYNQHNGYYGHEAKVQCTQLTYVRNL